LENEAVLRRPRSAFLPRQRQNHQNFFLERVMELLDKIAHQFLVTLGFTLMGLIAFALAFVVIIKATPFSLRKEIEEDHNVAFAIVIASVILGIAHIVASTVHG
jgi:hypothetical protein